MKCSHDIRIAGQPFSKLGQENTDTREDLHTHSLRQLSTLYHIVQYRLDHPFEDERYRPECLNMLRKDLDSALSAHKIPASWLQAFVPGRKSEDERAAPELNTSSSLEPLS